MPLHKLSDFAKLCGRKLAHISQDVSRGKITVNANNLVDDALPINSGYLQKWKSKKPPEIKETIKAEDFASPSKSSGKPQTKPAYPDDDELSSNKTGGKSIYLLDIEKKEKDIELITENIEIAKVKKEKLHGLVIPTPLVKDLFMQHTASIITSLAQANENHIMEFAKIKGISRTDLANLRKAFTDNMNAAVKSAVTISKSNLQSIIDNFSTKRAAGEKK